MRVVVVGAGAVGQVYGHHLAAGGAEVAVLVRPRRRREAEAGYVLTRIGVLGGRKTTRFVPAAVLTNTTQIASGSSIDQVWVAVPTPALTEELLADLAAAMPKATFVVLAPGHFVRERVVGIVGARRAVFGAIGLIGYEAPLEGSNDPRETNTPAGTAYFLSPTKLSGSVEARALEAVSALRSGGCPAELSPDATAEVAFDSAMLMPLVATLEIAGWSLRSFRKEGFADLAARATDEGLDVAAAVVARDRPSLFELAQPFVMNVAARLAPLFAPFDVEAFLRVHFTKVADQTRLLLARAVADAERLRLPSDALHELLADLDAKRNKSAKA